MARIEKTVFISYRRKDISWALAVYQDLTHQGYDVFFDYTNIPSGDFEQIIITNIKARAHFVLILTPTTLDRCSEPGDWLRREVETAIDEKRNIIPLFFNGFNFGDDKVSEKLTGKLKDISRYNGMNVHQDYFPEAMARLRTRFLNVPLSAVLHPVSAEVQEVVLEEQRAANKAAEEARARARKKKQKEFFDGISKLISSKNRRFGLSIIILTALLFWGISAFLKNQPFVNPQEQNTATATAPVLTKTPTKAPPTATNTPQPTFTPTPGIGSTKVSEKDGMVMVFVPAGEFTMGSDTDSDEQLIHQVNLDAFWIDQTEVTNAMYAKCVDDGGCTPPPSSRSYARDSYYGNSEFDDYPVIYVDWNKAKAYCEWVGRRLPTEAEWEKAARGTDGLPYPWGNTSPNNTLLNYGGIVGDTTEVGRYPAGASPYGAYDMAGNVWEWVNDWYSETYYQSSSSWNPTGPSSGQFRVLRGRSWYFLDNDVRSANRGRNDPSLASNLVGFRCSLSQP
jgi:formylglycine-generating enzyme required for sulfatase activity